MLPGVAAGASACSDGDFRRNEPQRDRGAGRPEIATAIGIFKELGAGEQGNEALE
jgi:hypothetical protein